MPYLKGGRALDVGCGTGRNALYLSQNGFNVDAWDVNENSLQTLRQICETEQIDDVRHRYVTLTRSTSIAGQYDFIYWYRGDDVP